MYSNINVAFVSGLAQFVTTIFSTEKPDKGMYAELEVKSLTGVGAH